MGGGSTVKSAGQGNGHPTRLHAMLFGKLGHD